METKDPNPYEESQSSADKSFANSQALAYASFALCQFMLKKLIDKGIVSQDDVRSDLPKLAEIIKPLSSHETLSRDYANILRAVVSWYCDDGNPQGDGEH